MTIGRKESVLQSVARTFSSDSKVSVTFGNVCAYDNEKRIIEIPSFLDSLDESTSKKLAGALDHEMWHAREDEEARTKRVTEPSMFMKEQKTSLRAGSLNVIEDIRIERRASSKYDGIRRNLDTWRAHCIEKLKEDVLKMSREAKLLSQVIIYAMNKEIVHEFALSSNEIDSIKEFVDTELCDIEQVSVEDFDKVISSKNKLVSLMKKLGIKEEVSKDSKKKSSSKGGDGSKKEDGKEETDDETFDLTRLVSKSFCEEATRKLVLDKNLYIVPSEVLAQDVVIKPEEDKEAFLNDLSIAEKIMNPLFNRLNLLLRARSEDEIEGEKSAGHIDCRNLYRIFTQEKNIFTRVVEAENSRKKIGLLIDESGSMRGPQITVARQAAIAFGETLHRLNVDFCIYGFSNNRLPIKYSKPVHGRTEALEMFEYKGMNELYRSTRFRLGSMRARENNSDGDALIKVANALLTSCEKDDELILFVLSDGEPSCYVDSSFPHDVNEFYNIECDHLKNVVAQIEKRMRVIGIGIMTDSVATFYKEYVVVNELKELPTLLHKKLSEVLLR